MQSVDFLESESVPPEANPPQQDSTPFVVEQLIEGYSAAYGLLYHWDPDHSPQQRADPYPSIQLETRGTTSHPQSHAPKPHNRRQQQEFWQPRTNQKFAIAAKLRAAGMDEAADTLEDCHTHDTFCLCSDCGRVTKFANRCDRFYCPECQPRLARDRQRQVSWWTEFVSQPKHVVLTARNVRALTRAHVAEFRAWWNRLRRRKFARGWRGGFYSLEVTNEGNGWHLHLHALVDANWIDEFELSAQWQSISRGYGRIVKVRSAKSLDYLAEVTKYVAKGNQLAAWQPHQLREFIEAFTGVRTFGVFGSLFAARTKFAEFLASLKAARPPCECGSINVAYYTEAEWLERDLQPGRPGSKPRPPPPILTPEFPTIAATALNWVS